MATEDDPSVAISHDCVLNTTLAAVPLSLLDRVIQLFCRPQRSAEFLAIAPLLKPRYIEGNALSYCEHLWKLGAGEEPGRVKATA